MNPIKNDRKALILPVSSKFVLRILLASIFLLLTLHIFGLYINHIREEDLSKIVNLFDFNQEANFPTFFSALLLFFCALLLFFIAAFHKKEGSGYLCWLFLAIIFLFLSFDETASVHELLIGITKRSFQLSGYFYYAWVVPYGFGLTILSVMYVPFLTQLPKKHRHHFFLSGTVYVLGAIGLEMLGGKTFEAQGSSFQFIWLYTCEELLEMLGVSLFFYALLTFIHEEMIVAIKVGK